MLRRRSPLQANAGLQPGKPLPRTTPLAAVGKRREAAQAGGKPVKPALAGRVRRVPDDLRTVLVARSGGRCEMALPGCLGWGDQVSHRISVKAGGRKGVAAVAHDRPSNTVWACAQCHRWCHQRPGEAYDLGLMLREYQEPVEEPVLYRGVMSYLDDGGGVLDFEEVVRGG